MQFIELFVQIVFQLIILNLKVNILFLIFIEQILAGHLPQVRHGSECSYTSENLKDTHHCPSGLTQGGGETRQQTWCCLLPSVF
jgi:hypothetical protein